MSYVYTEQEFAEKLEWEGGVWEVFEYGLKPENIAPGALRDFYEEAYPLFEEADHQIRAIEGYIETLNEPEED